MCMEEFEKLLLRKRKKTTKPTSCIIPFIPNVSHWQVHRAGSGSVVVRACGKGRWEVTANGCGVAVQSVMKMF